MFTIKDYNFDPGAMSIVQLGEELIGHPTTAINELVKNAYDADATECRVYIHYDSNVAKSFMVIFDSGLGMPDKTLLGEWLQPSVSRKRKGNRKSEIFERNYLGSKGIGRLAAMALGNYLTVITKTFNDKSYNWLNLKRDIFKRETLLSKVNFPGGKISDFNNLFTDKNLIPNDQIVQNSVLVNLLSSEPFNEFKEGTLIIVEELDYSIMAIIEDEFTNEDIKINETSIMTSLQNLITPLLLNIEIQNELLERNIISKKYSFSKEKSTFSIYFGTNLLEDPNKNQHSFVLVESAPILKGYDYRLIGKADGDGDVHCHYACQRLTEDTFEEPVEIDKSFVFSEESLRKRRVKEIEDIPEGLRDADVGEFFFDIRVYDRDFDSIDKMGIILKSTGKLETRRTLDRLLGLRISKNGFGIKPYGEETKDWMDLGLMRVQDPAHVISTNQILGNVFLFSPQNDGLSEKTNREGFFENKAFINSHIQGASATAATSSGVL